MTEEPDLADLVGAAEIAAMLGVTRQRVNQMATDPTYPFPKPVAELTAGRIWRRSDIKAWARRNRRKLHT